jgi:hypothetical protein
MKIERLSLKRLQFPRVIDVALGKDLVRNCSCVTLEGGITCASYQRIFKKLQRLEVVLFRYVAQAAAHGRLLRLFYKGAAVLTHLMLLPNFEKI